jgi:hypothetical protein
MWEMNRSMRSILFLWGRRLGIPLLKQWRNPATRWLIRAFQKCLLPGLPPERQPPEHTTTLREYVRQNPSTNLPLPPEHNPHQEAAARLRQARITGEAGQVCLADRLLSDVSFEWFMEPERLSVLYKLRLPSQTVLPGTGTTIAVISGHCYYHWLFHSLPRLGILEAAGIRLPDLDFIVTNPIRYPFQRESLTMLGVRTEQIRETHVQTTYAADTLILATIPGWIKHFHHEFLRTRLAPPPEGVATRRIYLARGGSRHRQVTNEPDVSRALAQVGIETCRPEGLPFPQQIRLFQSAQMVVAPHGAALSNIVFCQPQTTVVEIFSAHYFNDCYQTLAREAGLIYRAIAEASEIHLISDHHYVEEPITIDIPHLLAQLTKVGLA